MPSRPCLRLATRAGSRTNVLDLAILNRERVGDLDHEFKLNENGNYNPLCRRSRITPHRPVQTVLGGLSLIVALVAFALRWFGVAGAASFAIGLFSGVCRWGSCSPSAGLHHQAAGSDHQAGDAGRAASLLTPEQQRLLNQLTSSRSRVAVCVRRGNGRAPRAGRAGETAAKEIKRAGQIMDGGSGPQVGPFPVASSLEAGSWKW